MHRLSCIIGMLPAMLAWGSATGADEPGVQFFENKIRLVLVEHCYKCHSVQAQRVRKLKGGLLLDTRAGIRKGGESGSAVLPGNVQGSLIVEALRYESLEMPPTGKLPDAVIADFVEWIRMGAPDPRDGKAEDEKNGSSPGVRNALQFWAFQRPKRPPTPEVHDVSWPQSDIDRFILAKLEANGMHPSPPADRRTLLRRTTVDLTGLPPTLPEIDAFLSDGSADAYPALIERLLASPQYGERWGRYWLDASRYADTKG